MCHRAAAQRFWRMLSRFVYPTIKQLSVKQFEFVDSWPLLSMINRPRDLEILVASWRHVVPFSNCTNFWSHLVKHVQQQNCSCLIWPVSESAESNSRASVVAHASLVEFWNQWHILIILKPTRWRWAPWFDPLQLHRVDLVVEISVGSTQLCNNSKLKGEAVKVEELKTKLRPSWWRWSTRPTSGAGSADENTSKNQGSQTRQSGESCRTQVQNGKRFSSCWSTAQTASLTPTIQRWKLVPRTYNSAFWRLTRQPFHPWAPFSRSSAIRAEWSLAFALDKAQSDLGKAAEIRPSSTARSQALKDMEKNLPCSLHSSRNFAHLSDKNPNGLATNHAWLLQRKVLYKFSLRLW